MNSIGFLKEHQSNITYKQPLVDNQHCLCTGETGSGKTSSWANSNLRECLKKDYGVLLYDFKGEEHLMAKKLAHDEGKLNKVIELGKGELGKSINIMKYLTTKGIRSIISKLIGDDDMWSNGANDLCISILEIIKISLSLRELYQQKGIYVAFHTQIKFSSRGDVHERGAEVCTQHYPMSLSFQTLYNIVRDFKSFIMFIEGGDSFIENHRQAFKQFIFENKRDKAKDLLDYSVSVINKITALEKAFLTLNEYKGLTYKVENNRRSSGSYGLIFVLQSIKSLSEHDFLNKDDYDIIEGLNQGNFIVIQASLLSNSILNSLNKSILDELQRRTKQNTSELRQINIFLDEAQRLSDKNSDFQIDVLRSSKVFLQFACQSELLMIRSMGEENYLALRVNITKKFHFRDNTNPDYKGLDTHQYCEDDEDIKYMARPIFFSKDELLQTELLYQKQIGLHKNFGLNARKAEIIIFDEVLYEKSKMFTIFNIRTKTTRTIDAQAMNTYSKKMTIRDFLLRDNPDDLSGIREVLLSNPTQKVNL